MDNKPRNRLLLVLFIGVLMGALDIAIVGPALPTIRGYFAINDRTATWLFTIYVLFYLISTPLMAKLSDIFGRRTVYLADLLLFAAGSMTVALAPSFAMVLAGRAIQGFGSGGIFPVAAAIIGDTFPPEKRGSALGLIGAVFGLAFIIGPILGGVLLLAGWRWLFAVNLPILAAVLVIAPPLLPNTRPPVRNPFDWGGMLMLGVMLGGLTYGLNHIDTAHFGASLKTTVVWLPITLAITLLPIFLWAEQQAADPIIHLRLFKSRQLVIAGLLSMGGGVGEAAVVFVPALAIAAFGVKESTASFLLMPLVLALAVGAPTSGRMLDRYGSKLVILTGTSLLTAGMLALSHFAGNWGLFITATLLIGLGLSALLGAPIRYIMLNEAQAQDRAVAQALIAIFTGVGQLFSGASVGAIVTSVGGGVSGYSAAYTVIGLAAFGLILLSFGLKNRAKELSTMARQISTAKNLGQV